MKEVYDFGLLQILHLNRLIINSVKTLRSLFGLDYLACWNVGERSWWSSSSVVGSVEGRQHCFKNHGSSHMADTLKGMGLGFLFRIETQREHTEGEGIVGMLTSKYFCLSRGSQVEK